MKIAIGFVTTAMLTLGSLAHAGSDEACIKKHEAEHSKMTQSEMRKMCESQSQGSSHGTTQPAPAPATPAPTKGYDLTVNKRV